MASKKAKSKGKKKLDGKALAAKRKPRDSAAQYIRDRFAAGKTDVAKIVEGAKENFPKTKVTAGYVNWVKKASKA